MIFAFPLFCDYFVLFILIYILQLLFNLSDTNRCEHFNFRYKCLSKTYTYHLIMYSVIFVNDNLRNTGNSDRNIEIDMTTIDHIDIPRCVPEREREFVKFI